MSLNSPPGLLNKLADIIESALVVPAVDHPVNREPTITYTLYGI